MYSAALCLVYLRVSAFSASLSVIIRVFFTFFIAFFLVSIALYRVKYILSKETMYSAVLCLVLSPSLLHLVLLDRLRCPHVHSLWDLNHCRVDSTKKTDNPGRVGEGRGLSRGWADVERERKGCPEE
ncbi:hypothetical protein CBR_g38930 [Chara braunii]|uniref:Uncharacterized protein n=1 Tax=Chara braunii TaxID=69332 RepID=A0A388K0P4_CHABU|nr:hypothetical protein CBR_g38930 [Chara braunii]|eukprot:GBG63619.1 hypothetical protein CBR_g38930 [Chara braunii]